LDVRGSSGSRNFGSKRGSQEEARNQKADSHFGRERFKLTKEEIRRMQMFLTAKEKSLGSSKDLVFKIDQ
jgi:hypothetical protein